MEIKEIIETYLNILNAESFENYYKENINNQNIIEKLEYLKQIYNNNEILLTISIEDLTEEIAHIYKINKDDIKILVRITNTDFCPPLSKEEYIKLILKSSAKAYKEVSIYYKDKENKDFSYNTFDITLYFPFCVDEKDNQNNSILNHLTVNIFDEKEPTSTLYLKDVETIPLNITLKTFDDIYYSSYSTQNIQIFCQALYNYLKKQTAFQKVKKLTED